MNIISYILSTTSVLHMVGWILSTAIGAVIGVCTNIWLKRNSNKVMGTSAASILLQSMFRGYYDSYGCLYVAIKKLSLVTNLNSNSNDNELVQAMKLQANIPESDKELNNMKWYSDIVIALGKGVDPFDNALNNIHLFGRKIRTVREITLSHQKTAKEGILGGRRDGQVVDEYFSYLDRNLPGNIEEIIRLLLAMKEIMIEFNNKIIPFFYQKKIIELNIGIREQILSHKHTTEMNEEILNYIKTKKISFDGYKTEDIVSKLMNSC